MKNCKCRYYDRWQSEWVCSRYDAPLRVCCPCGRPEVVDREDMSEWELFDGGFREAVKKGVDK